MRMSGPAQSRKWWSHHSWRYLQDVYNMELRDDSAVGLVC